MPTISVSHEDMCGLLGRRLPTVEIAGRLELAKGELKSAEGDEIRIELNDTNRPDLWCAEGIARQLRYSLGEPRNEYGFFSGGEPPAGIQVDPEMRAIRPYVAGFIVRGLKVTDHVLAQLIQTQEKLCENFGSKRRAVAIGIYNVDLIRFPVAFRPVGPEELEFTPLEFAQPATPREILKRHPKGLQYGHLLEGLRKYPLLIDAEDRVLSLPPIINSREVGQVQPGDSNLFVEATGTDLRQVLLSLNILAANVADRGGRVEPLSVSYPYDTEFGRNVRAPYPLERRISASVALFEKVLGAAFGGEEIERTLRAYGCRVVREDDRLDVAAPPWRHDYMHPVDAVEDFAIARGYSTFEPAMPSDFTVGSLSRRTIESDRARDAMVGMGFEEIISPILGSRAEFTAKILKQWRLVEISNVMSESYAAVRPSVLPSLLRVESASSKALFPHRVFEVGEVAVWDESENHGSRTELRLCALIAHAEAGLSEAHAALDALSYYLCFEYRLQPGDDASFMEGRCAAIFREGRSVGTIGEINPAVLEAWGIRMPCSAFELLV